MKTVNLTLVDSRRSTPPTPDQAGAPTRTLETTVRFPTTSPRRALPLIVLAHGLNGDPDQLDDLSEAWASAGFVVAAPRFPRTNIGDDGKAILEDVSRVSPEISASSSRVSSR